MLQTNRKPVQQRKRRLLSRKNQGLSPSQIEEAVEVIKDNLTVRLKNRRHRSGASWIHEKFFYEGEFEGRLSDRTRVKGGFTMKASVEIDESVGYGSMSCPEIVLDDISFELEVKDNKGWTINGSALSKAMYSRDSEIADSIINRYFHI